MSKSNADLGFFTAATCLVAFFIPLIRHGLPLAIMVLGVAWILAPKTSFKANWKPILIFSAIYLFHLVAMLYTENMPKGKADLMQKLSLILFPVIFGSTAGLGRLALDRVLTCFLSGTLAAVLLSFFTAAYSYSFSVDSMDFYMSNFSPVQHPTYIAMYMNFGAFILLWRLQKRYYLGYQNVLAWLLLALFGLGLIFPASKAGFINFFVLLLFAAALIISHKPLRTSLAIGTLAIAAFFVLLLLTDPVAQKRVSKSVEITTEETTGKPTNEIESNTARLIAWKMALREIPNHPIGVGTGDIGDFLIATFRADGYETLADRNLNVHNSFLQIALAQGVLAMLVFIFSLLYPFRDIFARRDWVYGFFLVSIGLQFTVECMTETQSGVVYFGFFNALLYFSMLARNTHNAEGQLI